MDRRLFIKNTGMAAIVVGLPGIADGRLHNQNKLPQWKGFNLLDFFSPNPADSRGVTTEDHFRWMRDWGFNFVRIPMAYPYYLDIDRTKNITPDDVYKLNGKSVEEVDRVVNLAQKYHIHVSLNLHRAPGFCVNAGFYEPYNLWFDQPALDAFCFHWNMWAKRYKSISAEKLSFDLLNEPCMRDDIWVLRYIRSNLVHGIEHTLISRMVWVNWQNSDMRRDKRDPQGASVAQQQAITPILIHPCGGKQPGSERPPRTTDAVHAHDIQSIVIAKAVFHDYGIEADNPSHPTNDHG